MSFSLPPYLLKFLFKGAKVYVLTNAKKGDKGNFNWEQGSFFSKY